MSAWKVPKARRFIVTYNCRVNKAPICYLNLIWGDDTAVWNSFVLRISDKQSLAGSLHCPTGSHHSLDDRWQQWFPCSPKDKACWLFTISSSKELCGKLSATLIVLVFTSLQHFFLSLLQEIKRETEIKRGL
jgi:hypothetical protein